MDYSITANIRQVSVSPLEPRSVIHLTAAYTIGVKHAEADVLM